MNIKSKMVNKSGDTFGVEYSESDPLVDLEGKELRGVHAYCFCNDKMILVNHPRAGWTPPGGGIEEGETYEEAVAREVLEETNMKVISQKLIGFQDVYEPERITRQTRMCCIVEPLGEFVADPDGDITEIKHIDPKDYKEYFDWHEIGDRIMERALMLRDELLSERTGDERLTL